MRRIQNLIAVVLVIFLSILPLAIKILQEGFKLQILGSDTIQFNLVFLFACVAGIITWRDDRHLNLASIFDNASSKVKRLTGRIRNVPIVAILTALFFTAFSQSFTAFSLSDTVWGIPILFFFIALPLMYFFMLFMIFAKKEFPLFSIIGFLIGLFISTGPITGILYYLFQFDDTTLPFLYSITQVWMSIAQAFFPFFILLFVCFAFLGVPLFIVISAVAYIAFSQAGYVEVISLEVYNILTDKSIAAIPLFTIAGYILSQGSAGRRLLEVFKSLFGWFRGGTVIAAVIVTTFFTTFTGVSGVTILALGSLLTIVLTGTGYTKKNAQALVTVSGAIGLLFPPSVAIIMYGTVNFFTVNVFDLFKGAVIPGIMIAIAMIIMGFFKDTATERPSFSWKAVGNSIKTASLELIMPFVIIFSFFSGFFTLLETASFAVAYAFCMETFIRKDYTIKSAMKVIAQSIPITGGVLIILGAARGLSYYLVDANVPEMVSSFILAHVQSKFVFLLLLNVCLLVVGCLMDIYSAILIVSPLIIPVAQSFGISPIQTGIIFLMNLQLGFLTPPVGMDLFIASYAFNTPVMKVVKGVLPFLLVEFGILLLVTYIPWFTSVLV